MPLAGDAMSGGPGEGLEIISVPRLRPGVVSGWNDFVRGIRRRVFPNAHRIAWRILHHNPTQRVLRVCRPASEFAIPR